MERGLDYWKVRALLEIADQLDSILRNLPQVGRGA